MKKLSLEDLNRISVEDFKEVQKNNFILALDDIRSRNNVGSFFRTADAFRADSIILGGISPCPPHRDIEKTAIGATESVKWAYTENLSNLLLEFKTKGWKIAAIEQVENSIPLQKFKPKSEENYIFVFGNEVDGVSQEIINNADLVLEIPQFGTKHSLNVAVSGGIISWHYINAIL